MYIYYIISFDIFNTVSIFCLYIFFFFFKQKTAYEMLRSLVGSEMCIRDSLVIVRLNIWGFLALPALREYYEYIANPQCKRLGTAAWVGVIGLIAETTWIVKIIYAEGHYTQTMPANVALPLSICLVLFVSWVLMYYGLSFLRRWLITRLFMNIVFYSIPVILFVMCAMSNVDTEWKKIEFLELVDKYELWY
eukprot:TRINITY_DN18757_c0_g1_i1.p1 TRINITY_DN18757_c0_g1~~TRINITY_DN18757_c0_g1_i1.p1  ORF type:complete len:192 (+),score=53.17 TRINITY_DN18757_c0_g1_i1:19-594(+)